MAGMWERVKNVFDDHQDRQIQSLLKDDESEISSNFLPERASSRARDRQPELEYQNSLEYRELMADRGVDQAQVGNQFAEDLSRSLQ